MELLFSHPRFFILHAPETGNALSQQTAQPQWYKRGIIPCSPSRTPRCTSYNTSVPASHSTATQLPRVASSVSDTSCDTPCHSCRRAANRDRSAFSGKSIHHLYSTLPLDNDHPAAWNSPQEECLACPPPPPTPLSSITCSTSTGRSVPAASQAPTCQPLQRHDTECRYSSGRQKKW